ncbi:retinol dehydrogenase 14 isoform X5 [Lepeophtheirus salmonis]
MKSIRDFCTKILETESKIHVLINNNVIQWASKRTTEDGFELHWGINHMSNFVMTQLLLPLLHRAAPDARIINMTSSWYSRSKGINWNDPNFRNESYSACEAFNQSKLANILFTRELSKRLEGTGVNVYAIDPGPIRSGLGVHIIQGLGYLKATFAIFCWLPWLKTPENGAQTLIYAVTDERLKNQSGFYYKDCAVQMTNELAADMDASYRLWEMSERMAVLSS